MGGGGQWWVGGEEVGAGGGGPLFRSPGMQDSSRRYTGNYKESSV